MRTRARFIERHAEQVNQYLEPDEYELVANREPAIVEKLTVPTQGSRGMAVVSVWDQGNDRQSTVTFETDDDGTLQVGAGPRVRLRADTRAAAWRRAVRYFLIECDQPITPPEQRSPGRSRRGNLP